MNNEFAESDQQKSKCSIFISLPRLRSIIPTEIYLIANQPHILSIIISSQDVKDDLQHLNASKASGPDLISPRLLKKEANILALPYSIVFNRSLDQGYFRNFWKEANVSPIYKKGCGSLSSNYRPISLLCQAGKAMERCIHKYLYNYIVPNQILTPHQSGFVPSVSTTCQLLHTYHMFCEAVDNGKEVRTVFSDISKAFDRVWHKGLLHNVRGI